MSLKKKIFLSVSLVIALSAAVAIIILVNQRDEYLSMDDYSISESQYIYYSTQAYDEAYAAYDGADAFLDGEIEGVEVEEWIRNYAISLSKHHLAVNKMFDDLGLTLSSDDQTEIEETVYDEWNYRGRLAIYGPMGVDVEAYTDIVTVEKKFDILVSYYKEELRGLVIEEAIKEYLVENYASVIYIAMSYYTESEESSIEQYNTYCMQVEEGRTVEELVQELNALDTNLIVTSIDEDSGRLDYALSNADSLFPAQFISELFDAEIGEIIYFNDTANMTYCICEKTDILSNDYFLDTYRDEINEALISELVEDKLSAEIEDYDIWLNSRRINKFNVGELY